MTLISKTPGSKRMFQDALASGLWAIRTLLSGKVRVAGHSPGTREVASRALIRHLGDDLFRTI
jgi:hypothetical protein